MAIPSRSHVTPHVDVDTGDDEPLILSAVRELCNQLRANDPSLSHSFPFPIKSCYSEAECIAIFQALKENTSVKHIDFMPFGRDYTERLALAAAEFVESSTTLQTLDFGLRPYDLYGAPGNAVFVSLLLRARSRNTSVSKLIVYAESVRFNSVAFQELLTRTQTLQNLKIVAFENEAFDEVQTAAITSGFASNRIRRLARGRPGLSVGSLDTSSGT
jgi:hypothetical protein